MFWSTAASLSFSPSRSSPRPNIALRIDREMRAIAIEEAEHLVVADAGVGQDHEDQGIEVVGGRLERLDLADAVLEQLDLLGLVAREPGDAPFEHPLGQRQVVAAGDLQAVDDQGRRVRRGEFAEAGEPAPAAVGELHVGQALEPGGGHLRDLGLVEDRVVLVALPLLGPLARVAQLLGVEVGVLVAGSPSGRAQVDQDLLGDDRRQEPVQGLLGAAVGIIGEVGQGVDQGAGQGGRVPHFEPRLLGLALGRDADDDLRLSPDRAGSRRRRPRS